MIFKKINFVSFILVFFVFISPISIARATEFLDNFDSNPFFGRWVNEIKTSVWDSGNLEIDIVNDNDVALRYAQNSPGSIEHEAQVTALAFTGSRLVGPGVRFDSTGVDSMYGVSIQDGTVIFYRWNGGVRSAIASVNGGVTVTGGNFYSIRLRASGTTGSPVVLSVWIQDHGNIKPSDPAWVGNNNSPNAVFTDSATTGTRLDGLQYSHSGIAGRGTVSSNNERHDYFKTRAISDAIGGVTLSPTPPPPTPTPPPPTPTPTPTPTPPQPTPVPTPTPTPPSGSITPLVRVSHQIMENGTYRAEYGPNLSQSSLMVVDGNWRGPDNGINIWDFQHISDGTGYNGRNFMRYYRWAEENGDPQDGLFVPLNAAGNAIGGWNTLANSTLYMRFRVRVNTSLTQSSQNSSAQMKWFIFGGPGLDECGGDGTDRSILYFERATDFTYGAGNNDQTQMTVRSGAGVGSDFTSSVVQTGQWANVQVAFRYGNSSNAFQRIYINNNTETSPTARREGFNWTFPCTVPDSRWGQIVATNSFSGSDAVIDVMDFEIDDQFNPNWSAVTNPNPTPTPPPPAPTPTPTPQPTPVVGDINLDRIVNSLDWSIMNSSWFGTNANADLNNDGSVNSLDFALLSSNWLRTW